MSNTEHERFGDRGRTDGGAEPWLGEGEGEGELAAPFDAAPKWRAPGRPRAWAYVKASLMHPSNLIALAGVLMLGLIHPGAGVLLLGFGAEVFVLCLVWRSQWFRRCLDE